MKKLVATTTLTLALAACSQNSPDDTAPEPPTTTTVEEQPTTEEPTTAEPTEEPTSEETDEEVDEEVPFGLPPEGIDIETSGLVTNVSAGQDFLTVTHTYPGHQPITITDLPSDGVDEKLALAYPEVAEAGCQVNPIVYLPWQGTCEASDNFVHTVHEVTDYSPLVNPSTVTITITPDLPDGREGETMTVRYTGVTVGDEVRAIEPEKMGELYYAILTLLTTQPSGEMCDTAAGATLSLDLGPDNLYTGDFGMCQLDAADYTAFNTINDIVTYAAENGEVSEPVQ